MPKISILTDQALQNDIIRPHGSQTSKFSSTSASKMDNDSIILRSTRNNVSRAAKQAAMGSFGVIPGPIDGIAMNHPDRG